MKAEKRRTGQTFGLLSRLWNDDPQAEMLISKMVPYVERYAYKIDRAYPGEDMLPYFMESLYVAAYTWNPRQKTFRRWLHRGMIRPLFNMRARRARRGRGPSVVSIESYPSLVGKLCHECR